MRRSALQHILHGISGNGFPSNRYGPIEPARFLDEPRLGTLNHSFPIAIPPRAFTPDP